MAAPATALAHVQADATILVMPGNALDLAEAIQSRRSIAGDREAECRRILATCLSKSRGPSVAVVLINGDAHP